MSNLMNFSCPEGTFTLPQDAAFHTVNIIAFPDGSNITINRDKYAQGSTFADYLAGQMQKLNGGLPGFNCSMRRHSLLMLVLPKHMRWVLPL